MSSGDNSKVTEGLETLGQTAALLRRFGLRPTKGLGQHFLVDDNVRRKIIETAKVNSEDHILEVGAGIGSLTAVLAQRCRRVTVIEIDERLIPIFSSVTAVFSNVKLISADALKIDAKTIGAEDPPTALVSNLPYNIAAPLLIEYLRKFDFIKRYTVMVQREIAERILALPGSKNYGGYTVKMRLLAEAAIAFNVPRTVFLPPPRVDSAVVTLKPKDVSDNYGDLAALIDGSFSQRRKKLVNSAADALKIDRKVLTEALIKIGHSAAARAEELSADDFVALKRELELRG